MNDWKRKNNAKVTSTDKKMIQGIVGAVMSLIFITPFAPGLGLVAAVGFGMSAYRAHQQEQKAKQSDDYEKARFTPKSSATPSMSNKRGANKVVQVLAKKPGNAQADEWHQRARGIDSADHNHIRNIGPSVEAQLEQLQVLKGAGLLTSEEYAQMKIGILQRGGM